MLSYEPDDTIAHRLDPRSKLAIQIGFAITALAHTDPTPLLALTALTTALLWGAGVRIRRAIWAYRYALPFLVLAPLVAGMTLGAPWLDVADARESAAASYRILLIILVSAAYVRSTPVRASRAAIQRTIPGKPGQLAGMGIALIFRFLPLLRDDLRTIRDARTARLGNQRNLFERTSQFSIVALERAFARADRLALALQARCFAWNPTLPPLAFSRLDAPAFVLAGLLVGTAVL